MIVLSKQQIIAMHHALAMDTGGLDGLRDEGLLDSAIAAPFQTFDSTELFQSVHQKAARLACVACAKPPFPGWQQANRRTRNARVPCVERNFTFLYAR